MQDLLLFCRPGFEAEAGLELTDTAAEAGLYGYFQPSQGAGWVRFTLTGGATAEEMMTRVALTDLVFTRDWLIRVTDLHLPAKDRVGAVLAALDGTALPVCERVEVRVLDDEADRDLGRFARKWVAPLSRALRETGSLAARGAGSGHRLELLLESFESVVVALSIAGNRSPFDGGVPRLRLSASAPSRSAMKLDEAWRVFFDDHNRLDYLGGGRQAVDLGAAPGGWTWQLVRQGMQVTAVDNGPMNAELMATGQVNHVQDDGYRWRPKRAVDWMVCDIVDQPRKTIAMVSDWLLARHCRYCIFNLKLPMKKRYEEWLVCRDLLEKALSRDDGKFRLQARHLYHDREEITCFVERTD